MPERLRRTASWLGLLVWLGAFPSAAVEVPPAGSCPPYSLPDSGRPGDEDVSPPSFEPGSTVEHGQLGRLRDHLPPEVWQHRAEFFYEGMEIRVGPCHRRYPAPEAFRAATLANAGRVTLDADGGLHGFDGEGLPFDPGAIPDHAPDAGMRWAWSHRYRYLGAGLRGDFRIIHILRRGRKTERFEGSFFLLPMHGYPGADGGSNGVRFWAGGRFLRPAMARGLAWRQIRRSESDWKANRSDDVFVYLPDARRVKRAALTTLDGLFVPTYTRGQQAGGGSLNLPDQSGGTPDVQISAAEHSRRGFVGLILRPNAWRFQLLRSRDVLAPINADYFGYPANADRSYGPSGLSVANGRWEIRRAVVLRGARKRPEGPIASLTLYIDALTLAPLYLITRKANEAIKEVGIFVGRFSGDDPLAVRWAGSGKGFGTILPVAESFFVAGEGGWLRESFEVRSDPPSSEERRRFTSVNPLQRRGR